MASKSSISRSTISSVAKQRVQEELKKISTTKIESSDLKKLREEIIPPKTPLPKQKEIVTEKAEKHELDLGTKFTSLDLLQDTIKGLEDEVSRLMEESNQAQAELKRKRQKMQDGLMDLLRLQKLIEQINYEINEKTSEFNSKMDEMEKKRLEIMQNPNLTKEEKAELLKKVDEEVSELKRTHESALTLLQNEKEKLKDEARTEAKVLQKAFQDMEKDHLNELQELEKAKIGASPSEVLRIEEQILERKNQFEQKKHVMEKSASSRKYFFDDEGRYYLDDNGEKVYKLQGTTSSEMTIDSKGNLVSKFGTKIKQEIDSKSKLKETDSEVNPDRRRHKLKTGLTKLLKQDDLIKAIDQKILNDPNPVSLKIEKESLKDDARIEAQLLQTIFHEFEVEQIQVLSEIENLKFDIPASDLLKMVENYSKIRKYFFDENGIRFYLDKNGKRIFGDISPLESATSVASKILLGVQDECNRSRKKLKCGLLKLLKLQKLIEQIDKEICEEVARSKSRTRTPKEDCRQVVQENKRKVLTQLDKKLSTLKDVNCKAQKLQKNVKEVDQKVRASSSKSQSRPSTAHVSRPCSKQNETRSCALTCLQSKKEKLKDEARIEAQIIQTALHELKEKRKNICKELENLNIGPSPAELMKLVKETVAANKYFFDERGRFYFNQKGCRVYKQDSCTSSFMNCGAFSDPSSFDFSGNSEDFCCDPPQNPDLDYLKQTVGPALRCGLANMTMTNPPDPINYLANYLLQFRCNEIRSQRQKAEVEEILKLRREIFCEKKQENCAKTVKCPGIARKTSEFK